MLKRLELVGFKSFADKTRFDFAPGITGVVGPNGSGKSNVVDAVRWILGERSAKNLRGGEMADVIFNGSASRKSLGLAEVSVTFDNARRLLSIDADEVQLTRRVYRDGTGEYLINGQMARLKDIEEMLRGSGAGSGGYTIIAQGRVDELLQASTKDRRDIFDEAAGISRFKAKKHETLRKLAQVELNLTRSKDKLDALDGQLRTLRMQAAKAQKFKEHSDRLRELRVGLGAREYREFTAALAVERAALEALKAEASDAGAEAEALERRAKELDWAVSRGEEALRHHEAQLATARQQIAAHETNFKHERAAAAALDAELLKLGRQRGELAFRAKAVEADAARAAADAARADEHLAEVQHDANAAGVALAEIVAHLAELEHESTEGSSRQFDLVRQAAASRSAANAALAQVERMQKEYTAKLHAADHKRAQRAALAEALDGLSQAGADVQARLTAARARVAALHEDRDAVAARAEAAQARLEGLRVRQGDLRGRIDVLEGLERSQEGLGAGVRQVVERLSDAPDVFGLVADLLTVPREVAPLVELALGETAQRFVVRAGTADAVAAAAGEVAGRVGFVPVQRPTPPAPPSLKGRGEAELGESSDVDAARDSFSPFPSGRGAGGVGFFPFALARFVSCEHPDAAGLPEQLLGRVLVADTLAHARRLSAEHPECRVVARTGELLEPDGTLTVGPLKAGAEAGLVSRKSELRDLREQHRTTSAQVARAEVELADLRRQADEADGVIEAVRAEVVLLSDEAGGLMQRIAAQRQQVESLDAELDLNRSECRALERQVQEGEAAWVAARAEAEDAEEASAEIAERLAELKRATDEGAEERERRQQAHTGAQVALGRAAADRDRARERAAQLESEARKRKVEAVNLQSVEQSTRNRRAETVLNALRASAAAADAYAEKGARERVIADLTAKAAADRTDRETTRERLGTLRNGWQEAQRAAHARELAVHDLSARRDAVAARIREDYALELDATPDAPDAPPPAAAQGEIDDLKRKLARLGSVNMEALEELARVEGEFNALHAQHDDLNAARGSLQQVIDAINADSRQLFTTTLAAVRGYFQELFRKLFGGGQADIILEDPTDVLESGIEITARPPGKELRSLSLLSGGEKTLTAVALLLAIFRNKPSPFCILDEVDAALDEANTQRLASVLRDFLDRSQFIVITHKKRTMAAADRLWGVTMQESGVSRLLPMRFEDWPDDAEQPAPRAA